MSRFLLVVLVLILVAAPCHAATLTPQQITPSNDGIGQLWDRRNSTTSGGQILFLGSNDKVFLFNGSAIEEVQVSDPLNTVTTSVFGLGSGTAGHVIGGWRRGAVRAHVSTDGDPPVTVNLNPEAVAIGDGCVFVVLQTGTGNHVFSVNPATGATTQRSVGTLGANLGAFRVVSSGCSKAAWTWMPVNGGPIGLQYWDGTSVETVETEIESNLSFAGGMLVYTKVVSGIQQVFVVDTNEEPTTPVQLSSETDATKTLARPQTDGRHVAWYRHNTNGSNPDSAQIILNGGLAFPTGPPAQIDIFEFPFQLQRGQLLWKNASGTFSYDDGMQTHSINPSPATTVELPWLTDGFIAFFGLIGSGDKEVFRITGTAPADASQPSPPLLVVPTPGTTQVRWDSILGATSYNAYVAFEAGVTKDNFALLTGGRRITNVTSGFSIPDIPPNTTYFVAITALDGVTEGPSSRAGSTTFVGTLTWQSVGALAATTFFSVAADATNASIAYAGANGAVFKSSDAGIQWTPVLNSATTGSTIVRALTVASPRVFASTNQGDLWRSPDQGVNWTRVLDALGNGALGSLLVDPANSNTVYAGDFDTASPLTESTIVKSVSAGDIGSWTHTAQGPSSPDEIGANALAGTVTTIYAGANGTPNAAKTINGGTSWTSAQIPAGGQVRSLAVDPSNPNTIYAATRDKGVFKSFDGGTGWATRNTGLSGVVGGFSGGAEFNSILVDPTNSNLLHLGAGNGYWLSLDGGDHWMAANNGFTGTPYIFALAMTPGRRLIAATDGGLYLMSFAQPPSVSNVAPSSGNVGGGTSVTITGSGFQAGATVTFGGAAATVTFLSATTINVTTPAHAAGAVAVVVTNTDNQSATMPGAFTYANLPDVPTAVVATAQTTTSILVTWTAASGAASYQVWRKAPGVAFTQVGTPTVPPFNDASASADTAYQYRVRSVNGSGTSADSATDLATTVLFTNEPIGSSVIVQAAHLSQLRNAILAVRQLAGGLPSLTFTDSASPGVPVKAVHITEIRSGLDAALTPLGLPAGGYTNPTLTGVLVKAVHVQEIRNRVK